MNDRELERIIKNSEKFILKDEDKVRYLNEYMNSIAEYARKILKQNPTMKKEKIPNYIIKEFHSSSVEYCKCAFIRSICYQYEALKELSSNKNKIKEIYAKIAQKDKLRDKFIYGDDLEKNLDNCLEEVVGLIEREEKSNNIDGFSELKDLSNAYEKANDDKKMEIRSKYQKTKKDMELIKMLLEKDYPTKIQYYIKRFILPDYENKIRKSQIQVLELMHEQFNKFELLPKYLSSYNFCMQDISLRELKYELSTGSTKEDEAGIEEIFSEEYLRNIDVEKIMKLSLFWQNRFAKETDALNEAFFAINTLKLWDDILEGKEISINKNIIQGVYSKINCMKKVSSRLLLKAMQKHQTNEKDKAEGYRRINVTKEINEIVKQEEENYKKIYDKKLPKSSNCLEEDIEVYRIIYNLTENIYKARNSMLMTQLELLNANPHAKNWGIVRNEYLGYGEFKNTENDKFVLINIDCEGFNMPLRLHVRKAKLIETLGIGGKKPIIPEYIGDKDFIINGTLIKNHVFMPMNKQHKKFISSEYGKNEGTGRDRLLGHLRYLKDKGRDKFPKHLMNAVQTKKGTKYQMPKTKYFNLETGEEYYLEEGEYVPIANDGGKNVHGR